ncbi:hypothetical protein [Treponema endosymbiont of Eucomonympha sp.]|uniref:hypothetical protein n=1 Tax=Treponema endosymbiont of Eucomonympha sp. TaxID=1580831 RepID=UPI0013969F83|nr:hypothetical protein [Treponema endosymbiont of Eucomonympha sp.]
MKAVKFCYGDIKLCPLDQFVTVLNAAFNGGIDATSTYLTVQFDKDIATVSELANYTVSFHDYDTTQPAEIMWNGGFESLDADNHIYQVSCTPQGVPNVTHEGKYSIRWCR